MKATRFFKIITYPITLSRPSSLNESQTKRKRRQQLTPLKSLESNEEYSDEETKVQFLKHNIASKHTYERSN